MITPSTFRKDLKEFASKTDYPEETISYWIAWGVMLINTSRFGPGSITESAPPTTPYDFALELFVAHHVTLAKQSVDAAKVGTSPGAVRGPVASKSVGPGSISYDTGATLELNAGHWNMTTYGTRFIQLARMFGAGPMQIGVGCDPTGGLNGPAWPGPWPFPLPGGSGFG